jgi:uncharacterized NAD(P)/FAD-binding protein YdhS
MTAVQLIHKCYGTLKISLISDGETLNRGIAFSPYSKQHLLNVVTQSMSAFPDRPAHFLDWVMSHPDYRNHDRNLIAHSFLPRYLFGEYIHNIWNKAEILAKSKGIIIEVIDAWVTDLEKDAENIIISCSINKRIYCHDVVIASGNQLPRNHPIENHSFYNNASNYFQNPWNAGAVKNLSNNLPILLIGNGLTMVDTVVGLLENGFTEKIISISPNGFNLLPHRHSGIPYTKMIEEASPYMQMLDWLRLVNKHRKQVRKLGVSAEPIIDSLRAHSQDIWIGLSVQEKAHFLKRLRHLWGVARHRVPLQMHDRLINLRLQGRLEVFAGKVLNMANGGDFVRAELFDKQQNTTRKFDFERVINCSGPESDIEKMDESFLKKCLQKGLLKQDINKLGIEATWPGMQIIDGNGNPHENIYTLGSNLRGVLWESTAVKELREQAVKLADIFKGKILNEKLK